MQMTFYKLNWWQVGGASRNPISFIFQNNRMTSKKGRVDTKRWAYETLFLKIVFGGFCGGLHYPLTTKVRKSKPMKFFFEGIFVFSAWCVERGLDILRCSTKQNGPMNFFLSFGWKQNVQESTGEFLHKCGHW